ncbi:MAG TPA: DUF3224 domain-containing protein [Pseudonocardiaceae bacterium]
MSERATIGAANESWDEKTYAELPDGGKLTRATVVQKLTGDLDGRITTEFLMCYRPDGTATYLGQSRIEGTLAGRTGSFVVQGDGEFDGTTARTSQSVVAGSGTGELRGISGSLIAGAEHGPAANLALSYEFE